LATLDIADHDPEFWSIQLRNLRNGYRERIRGRMERHEINRLAIFALAPIPLLFELGRLVSDIATVEVRQFLRDPKGWKWDLDGQPVRYQTTRQKGGNSPVALKLEISAEIADERVHSVLGQDTAIWSIAAVDAHNDIMRRPEDLAAFAKLFRKTLDDIKLVHGENVVINVFPAVPVSVAVEAGRSWQPKAHPTLKIFDQNRKLGGFVLAHQLEHPY
jgi:SMODS-associated and fused to various effectors sensor domain